MYFRLHVPRQEFCDEVSILSYLLSVMGETLSLSTNFTRSIGISTLFSQYVASKQRQQFQK